jgi:hypothetical protein
MKVKRRGDQHATSRHAGPSTRWFAGELLG